MDKRVCPLLSPCIAVRRNHFLVAATVNLTADVVLEGVHHLGAVGVPEHHARRMVFDVVEIHLTPSASAAAPRLCQNSEAQAFCRDTRLARFSFTRAQKSAPSHIGLLGVPTHICVVGLYFMGCPAHSVPAPRGHYP